MGRNPKTKVLIIDDHPIFRKGLRTIIDADDLFEVVGEADNGRKAIELTRELDPDVVLIDVDMPEMDGIETVKQISVLEDPPKICFLTLHNDRAIVNAMKRLKVDGYILKDVAVEEIIDCLLKIVNDEAYVSPQILKNLLEPASTSTLERKDGAGLASMTPTELKIIKLVAEGKTTREIAEISFVSTRTVENHRSNICAKLGLRGNHALLKYALAKKEELLGPE